MLKSCLKPIGKMELISFKVTPQERAKIKAKADEHAGGNMSEWCRYAAIELDPNAKDLVVTASPRK